MLVLCLDYLQKKDGGLCLINTQSAGRAFTLSNSEEAAKTGEWERGIGRLLGQQ